MVIGYVEVDLKEKRELHMLIRAFRERHRFVYEMKFNKLSKSAKGYYQDVVDLFFRSPSMRYRAIVVDKQMYQSGYTGDYLDFYYKMIYQLVYHGYIADSANAYAIYVDIRDTKSGARLNRLKGILQMQYSNFIRVQAIHSHESDFMQLCDVLTGAIAYKNNYERRIGAKAELIEQIESTAGVDLIRGTPRYYDKFNLFRISLKG